jgi:hypothetical protein
MKNEERKISPAPVEEKAKREEWEYWSDTEEWQEEWEYWGDQDEWKNWDKKDPEKKDPYEKRTLRARVEERRHSRRQARNMCRHYVEQVTKAANRQCAFQLITSALFFIGGAWALMNSIRNIATGNLLPDSPNLGNIFFSPPVLSGILGLILVSIAVYVSRYPAIQNALTGISRILLELTTGSGESKPLVQVVQETINNARQTFVVQLRLSQATFWAGILFVSVAFYTILKPGTNGEIAWETTATSGGAGVVSWIFSYFIAQRKNIQSSLTDVTQLEIGLVGLAKQVDAIDRWLSVYLIEPYSLSSKVTGEATNRLKWALQGIQQSTFASASMVELYAQKEFEIDERLLRKAVETYLGLANTGAFATKKHSSNHLGSKF